MLVAVSPDAVRAGLTQIVAIDLCSARELEATWRANRVTMLMIPF